MEIETKKKMEWQKPELIDLDVVNTSGGTVTNATENDPFYIVGGRGTQS